MKILVLHAYSAENLGDGLLVAETLNLIREAFGDSSCITVLASHPKSFENTDARIVDSSLNKYGYSISYIKTLFRIGSYDKIVAVGGGYLRAGNLVEALKSTLIHGPQLLAASLTSKPTYYLPQSVGPIRFGMRFLVEKLLSRLTLVALRDQRSMSEVSTATPQRFPDLALLGERPIVPRAAQPDPTPVLSIRHVNGRTTPALHRFIGKLESYDAFVQSTTSGNNDIAATAELSPRRLLSSSELMSVQGVAPRVVVAVRLHAALMALRSGHFVIHLAYERKGFGAFEDLGLRDFVHNVNSFDADKVFEQMNLLHSDPLFREVYRNAIRSTQANRENARKNIVSILTEH